ncbi:voltage-dependent L-type calcium channel subunit [Rhynchospora pubera]|uniref:Voltage-dependent L-type calcium channel subunit n=1 Tax=Rhynchospora pubera TaxID=906938 RepID=A0AAV8DCH2_9POAL|nr:voltage-dependent L-type calcium channel subunit [Rhynchospora pubera]
MAEWGEETEGSNGVFLQDDLNRPIKVESIMSEGHTLPTVVRGFVDGVLSTDGAYPPRPFLRRVRIAATDAAPKLKDASKNSARDLVVWTRQGSSLRALLVITVGSITLVSVTAVSVFMLFLLAATANAVVISFFVSLAAAGGFLAFFFACLTAIYVGVLCVAFFVISTVTVSAIIATLIATVSAYSIGYLLLFFLNLRFSLLCLACDILPLLLRPNLPWLDWILSVSMVCC